jgi:hypothetical protein
MTNQPIVCSEELFLALLRYLPSDTVYLGGEEDETSES